VGSDSLEIEGSSLRIEKDDAELVDEGLRIFQGVTDIEGEFIFLGDGVFGFHIGDYDKSELLVIDPLVYSTYVSGSNHDRGEGIAVDDSGNVYVTGYTKSTDFPTSLTANDTTGDGSTSFYDVFVFKLSSDGKTLIYSTYVSGSDDDKGYGIAIDNSGNAYVTGSTASTDFPTESALYTTSNGNIDVFAFKLSADGSSLLYSTYMGGSVDDVGKGITIDSSGNAYITGNTKSTDFPTKYPLDATGDGNTNTKDAFVFKLFNTGDILNYSTYVSGSMNDEGTGIAIDSLHNAYVTGFTYSTDFPTTIDAYDVNGDGTTMYKDVFVLKLDPYGSNLDYSTYVNGSHNDEGYAIKVDSGRRVYVTGRTYSIDFPTKNAFNATGDGLTSVSDVFVFKLSSDGETLIYSTYVSGSSSDFGRSIAVDSSGNAYVTGYTNSRDFPTMKAYNATGDGLTSFSDVFVFKLTSDGGNLNHSTYVSGSNNDYGYGITIDSSGNAYVTGYTFSTDFPTWNAYNATGDGNSSYRDVFVLKLIEDNTNPDLDSPSDFSYEQGTIGNKISWTVSDMTPIQYEVEGNGSYIALTPWSSGSIDVSVDGHTPGVYNYTITVVDLWGNEARDEVFVTVKDTTPPDLNSPDDFEYEPEVAEDRIGWIVGDLNPHRYRVDGNGSTTDWTAWSKNETIYVNVDEHVPGVYNYTITVEDYYGNQAVDTVLITVVDTSPPVIEPLSDFAFLVGSTEQTIIWAPRDLNPDSYDILKDGISAETGDWNGSDIIRDLSNLPIGSYNFTLIVWDTENNSASDTVIVTVNAEIEETDPPEIFLVLDPTAPTQVDDVKVIATISDENEISIATLQYSNDSGISWNNVTMVSSGGFEWTGYIPKHAIGVEVRYRVYARDALGNWGVSSPNSYVVRNSENYVTMIITILGIGGTIIGIITGIISIDKWRKKGSGKEELPSDTVD
jgi:hypothetical protein